MLPDRQGSLEPLEAIWHVLALRIVNVIVLLPTMIGSGKGIGPLLKVLALWIFLQKKDSVQLVDSLCVPIRQPPDRSRKLRLCRHVTRAKSGGPTTTSPDTD